ncbi:efflux RND transporter periplasmic adaptor subunit [Caulobacter sp. SL161]|uniref:efflux RND transporter periplasmic adaptor subunit n=1 Tax=Caulobacter sp. SL161 TaxID=2995156 RepID=UPI002275B9E6|nr:efflux RND transporter periplasmic adaptor subunit [Caulobacter sp. SL161]MCY1649142.1 efflux RND transporter periplasmic adaptor subunit [Caulobacter sp. SL161]
MTTRYLIATALVCAGVGLTACGDKKDAPEAAKPAGAEQARAVSITRVETRALGGGFKASGQLIPREEAAVGSELSGYRVARVFVEEGAWVKAGQPLAQLDNTLLRAQIAQQAAVAAQAEAEAQRVTGLAGQGMLSQEQIESRRYAAKAQAAALAELQTRDRRMTITAPVSGRVLERTVRPGDVAGGTTPWFRIARDGLVELNAEVNEADLSSVRIGQPVRVSVPGGATVSGEVRIVSPLIDTTTRLGRVRVRLPLNEALRSGGVASAEFAASGAQVPAVPEAALRLDAEGASLMAVDDQNRARQIPVKTGLRAGGWVQLIDGPAVGTRVLLGGSAFTLDGDKVKPLEKAAR